MNILLGGKQYDVAEGKSGQPLVRVQSRPSQPGDPSQLLYADWRLYGPDLTSSEQGYLGRDWGDGTDGRNLGIDILGPKVNTIDCGTFDAAFSASIPSTSTFKPSVNLHLSGPSVAADARGMAVINGPLGVPYGYVVRGNTPAKIDLSDMTLKRSGEQLTAPGTTILTTRAATGAREVSVGMEHSAYRVLTAVATPPTPDTWATNSGSEIAAVIAKAPDRVVTLDTSNRRARANVLTGSVTMVTPTFATLATEFVEGQGLEFTGFALDGRIYVIGTSNGPYILDVETGDFYPLIDEIDNDLENCRGMTTWFPIGVVIPLHRALRYLRSGGGASFGPEVFGGNTSPVQGHPQAFAGGDRWGYATVYNEVTGNTYLCAVRPRQPGDPHGNPVSWFTIAKFTSKQSRFLQWLGTLNGDRTLPTLMGGYGDDVFWISEPRTVRVTDDSSYQHALSGTTYLTEMRRERGTKIDIESVELETQNCTANRTVTVGISLDGGAAQTFTAITSNGFQRLYAASAGVPTAGFHNGHRAKPQIAYATNDASESPYVVGDLRVFYRQRPLTVRTYEYTLVGRKTEARTPEGDGVNLRALMGSNGPVAFESHDRKALYVRVDQVEEIPEEDRGTSPDSARHLARRFRVSMTEWATS